MEMAGPLIMVLLTIAPIIFACMTANKGKRMAFLYLPVIINSVFNT